MFTIDISFSQGRKHIGGRKTDLWRKIRRSKVGYVKRFHL